MLYAFQNKTISNTTLNYFSKQKIPSLVSTRNNPNQILCKTISSTAKLKTYSHYHANVSTTV